MKVKLTPFLLAGCLLGGAIACNGGGEDDATATALLALFAVASADQADIYPDLGFPGTLNQVSGEFPGSGSEYTVTIGGANAAGVSLLSATKLQFTMPGLSEFADNVTVPIVIKRNGETVLSKTIRYRPAPGIALNAPNAFNRKLNAADTSSFFTVVIGSSGNHIFNVFGYGAANLDLYYLSSPTATPVAIATSAMTDAEFERVNMTAGTYYLQVRRVSGFLDTFYRTNIANGEITPASTSNETDSFARCYDFAGSGTTANAAGGCAAINAAAIGGGSLQLSGRCTYPSSSGIATRHYYIHTGSGYGFDPFYAEQTCLQAGLGSINTDQAIFQF